MNVLYAVQRLLDQNRQRYEGWQKAGSPNELGWDDKLPFAARATVDPPSRRVVVHRWRETRHSLQDYTFHGWRLTEVGNFSFDHVREGRADDDLAETALEEYEKRAAQDTSPFLYLM